MADTSALDALAALADELEAAKTALRGYERMLDWHVTCERCAAQLDELYAATVAREVLSAALDSPPGAATLVELATEAARRLTGIADLDAERAAQGWAVEDVFYLDMCRERDHERAMRAERTAERDRARGTAVALEAENARLREGIERLASDLYNPLHERDGAAPQDMPEVAEDLRALLADTDSAREDDGGTMTPEQRVYRAMADAALHPIPPGLAWYAVEAVRAALTSDDPEVVRAMAERVGLTVSTRERYEAVCLGSLKPDGQPRAFSFGADRAERVLERIRRSELGLSPETHICMRATQTSASVSTWSAWREVPDAD